MNNGFLVCLEGLDGTGKTSLSKLISENLTKLGFSVLLSREPTDGQFGKKIRESAKSGRLSLEDELNLFIEDRKEHINEKIIPALTSGKIVILDRYYFSTMAYQGARGADMGKIAELHKEFAIDPDLLVLMQINVDIALSRIVSSRDGADLFEGKEYLQKVSDNYEKISHPNMFKVDAHQSKEQLTKFIVEEIVKRIDEREFSI